MLWKRHRTRFLSLAATLWVCSLMFTLMPSKAVAEVVFESSSGSYFELFHDQQVFGRGGDFGSTWERARKFARTRFHKGRRGQLATIRTQEVHKFITENFNIRINTWIGLRYFCANRSLMWVNGERINRATDFVAWHRQWRRGGAAGLSCSGGGNAYLPVYYTALGTPLWQASGPGKGFSALLIEYPEQ